MENSIAMCKHTRVATVGSHVLVVASVCLILHSCIIDKQQAVSTDSAVLMFNNMCS